MRIRRECEGCSGLFCSVWFIVIFFLAPLKPEDNESQQADDLYNFPNGPVAIAGQAAKHARDPCTECQGDAAGQNPDTEAHEASRQGNDQQRDSSGDEQVLLGDGLPKERAEAGSTCAGKDMQGQYHAPAGCG